MSSIVVGAIVGGVAFRLRGSDEFKRWTGRGATTARFMWGTALAAVCSLPWQMLPFVIIAAWLGCLPGWWGSLTLGRNPAEGSVARQWLMHILRGFVWVLPLAALFAAVGGGWWWLLLAGATCAPAYELGWRVIPRHATELGEALFGAAIGAAVAAAV